jgi:photosystem II stability/assembly factor-like uncharacterized protein
MGVGGARVRFVRAAVAVTVVGVAMSCGSPRSRLASVGHEVTLLYRQADVKLVAVAAAPEESPSRLFISADGARWKDVTPAASQEPVRAGSGFVVFQQASFLNSSDGWVVACAEASDIQTVFETTDGGTHWRAVRGPGCDMHGSTTVQLLNPRLAIADDTVCPGLGCAPLESSSDGGITWHPVAVRTEGGMEINGRRVPDPTNMWPVADPIRFVTPDLAFAADGLGSPYGAFGYVSPYGYFVRSIDGGKSWNVAAPPAPGGAGADHVRFDLPVFFSPTNGVVAVLDHSPAGNQLGFDTTKTAGQSWTLTAILPVARIGGFDSDYAGWLTPTYSVVNPSTWWVANPARPISIDITTNAGRTWSTVPAAGLPAAPEQIVGLDDHRALATVPIRNADTTIDYRLYESSDEGRNWSALTP